MKAKNSKNLNENPLDDIDLNDPYWREKRPTVVRIERWQQHILQGSEFWKGKRSQIIRDLFTDALTENGFAQVDRAVKRKELVSIVKTAQARIKGIDLADALELQEALNKDEALLKADVHDLMISQKKLTLAKRLYVIRKKREIHHDASKFNESKWVTENLQDLEKNGYAQKPAAALQEIKNLIETHQSEWDRELDK